MSEAFANVGESGKYCLIGVGANYQSYVDKVMSGY